MVLFSGLLYQRSKISSGLQWLANTSMVCPLQRDWDVYG